MAIFSPNHGALLPKPRGCFSPNHARPNTRCPSAPGSSLRNRLEHRDAQPLWRACVTDGVVCTQWRWHTPRAWRAHTRRGAERCMGASMRVRCRWGGDRGARAAWRDRWRHAGRARSRMRQKRATQRGWSQGRREAAAGLRRSGGGQTGKQLHNSCT